MAPNCYDSTQEALIYRSLQEIMRIWSRGSGQADLSLSVNDGKAQLNISVSLERPPDSFLPSSEKPGFSGHTHRRKKKKSPSKVARDRKRAENYRTKKTHADDIVLPISGQLMKLNAVVAIDDDPIYYTVEAAESTPEDVCPPKRLQAPPIKSSLTQQHSIDVGSARKTLFPTSSPSKQLDMDKGFAAFKKKEDELWSKIFK